jgi:hypothetical protein
MAPWLPGESGQLATVTGTSTVGCLLPVQSMCSSACGLTRLLTISPLKQIDLRIITSLSELVLFPTSEKLRAQMPQLPRWRTFSIVCEYDRTNELINQSTTVNQIKKRVFDNLSYIRTVRTHTRTLDIFWENILTFLLVE